MTTVFTTLSQTVLRVRHVLFLLQSNAHSASHLDKRAETFVQATLRSKLQGMHCFHSNSCAGRQHIIHTFLSGMSEAEFAEFRDELRKAKMDAPKNLRQAAAREWWEVQEGTLVFGRAEKEVAALETVTLAQLRAFANEYVFDERTRRRMAVHVRKEGEALEEGGVDRTGLWSTKRGLTVF